MAQLPTSGPATINNAAKDDAVGLNGDYTFTISDLLANDPGGAAKVDVTKQFFFGDTAADKANQEQYLIDHGITDNHDGTYTINPNATDFNYFVQIGNRGTWSEAHVDVTAPVVEAVNHAPVVVAHEASAYEDAVVEGSVATNDSDVDGNSLTYSLDTAVAGLTMKSDGSYTFDAAHADYQSLAQDEKLDVVAHYTVDDGHGDKAPSTFTIHLTGTNDAPVAVADVNSGLEDSIITGNVSANDSDVDHGAVLSYNLNAPVAGLTINNDGTYSFDAGNAAYQHLAEGVSMDVVAKYTATDEHGAASTSTLTITLTGTNDAPVAVADTNSGQEDTIISGNVSANDSDVDGDALTYSLVGDTPAGLTFNSDGTYKLDAGHAAYQDIHLGKTADVKFDYTISDGHGGSDTATATISITGNADLYHGSVQSETYTKTAESSSGNGSQNTETFHFNLVQDEGSDAFDFTNAAVAVTVQGDMDGKNESATVLEVSGADFANPDGGDVFKFSGDVNNSQDKNVNDGFPHDNFTVVLDNELPVLSTALADGHVDFDVTLSAEVGNGTTVKASMDYDYWM